MEYDWCYSLKTMPPQDETGDWAVCFPFPPDRTIPEVVPEKTKEEKD